MKPFNLTDAKLGHPVQTRDGQPATILKFDARAKHYQLVGVYGGEDAVRVWANDGRYSVDLRHHHDNDLVMAPVGTIDGKPVYPGDMISVRCCDPFPAPFGPNDMLDADWAMASWPRQYPLTQMNESEVMAAVGSTPYPTDYVVAINAAIAHGIEHGYLLDAREFTYFTPSDGSPITPAFIVQAARNLIKERDALLEMNSNQAATIAAQPERLRAIMGLGINVGWQNAHYSIYGNRPYPPAPLRSADQLDKLIEQVE